ncbi:MAG: hypothetical protein JKY26_06465 [Pseudomonas sp.]|nr:hypothetical protein [Pseudomonas sp.]
MTENNSTNGGRTIKNVSLDTLLAALPSENSLSASDDPWYVLDLCRRAIADAVDECEPLTVKLPEEWDVGDTGPQIVMSSDEVKDALKANGIRVS